MSVGTEIKPEDDETKGFIQSKFDDSFGLYSSKSSPRSDSKSMKSKNIILGFIPILQWLPKYDIRENLLPDIIGGLTVGIMHVPQGMAYSSLAGVRPVNGLYTSLFPAFLYMLFGTSRHVSLGVFAVVSLLVGSCNLRVTDTLMDSVQELANDTALLVAQEDDLYYNTSMRVVTSLTLLVGMIQIAMAVLRMDFLTSFLSDQIITGFTTGAAVHVFVAQLNKIIGVTLPRHSGFGKLYFIMHDLISSMLRGETNYFTLSVSIITIVALFSMKVYLDPIIKKRFKIPIPYELFIMILGTIVSGVFNFHDNYGVKVIGVIPTGLPLPSVPDVTLFRYFIKDAVAIAVVSLVVTISMGKLFAKKHGYETDVRQEFYALGIMESVCSLFPVWPASTALARTLVYEAAGTKTQLATVFSSALLLAVIFFVGPFLEVLPMCFLSCIIIVALKGMFLQLKCIPVLWRSSQTDCAIFVITMLFTVILDVVEGLLLGVLFALAVIIHRILNCDPIEVGEVVGAKKYFRPLMDYSDSTRLDGVIVVQFPAPLLFLNVENFRRHLDAFFENADRAVAAKGDVQCKDSEVRMSVDSTPTKPIKYTIIDLSKINCVDYSGAQCLAEVYNDYKELQIEVMFTAVPNNVRKVLFSIKGFKALHAQFYPSIEDALDRIKAK